MTLFLHLIVAIHVLWAVLLIVTPETQSLITASIYPLKYLAFGNSTILAVQYFVTSTVIEIFLWLGKEDIRLMTPKLWLASLFGAAIQQAFVTLSGAGSLIAILQGAYLDGTVTSVGHVLGDQGIYVVLAVFHVVALLQIYVFPFIKMAWR